MATVITRVQLDEAVVDQWDAAMVERMSTAESVHGWISGAVLRPADAPDRRVIVGVWESQDAWKAWHEAPEFEETRRRLDELGVDDGDTVWHEDIYSALG
jgi:heme-degrading monooxygenase HmoA